MVTRWFARALGLVLALLAVVGFFAVGEHLLGVINVDVALDTVRLVFAGLLVWAGFLSRSRKRVDIVLRIVGATYVVLAIIGTINAEVFGVLSSGLTGFDVVFHVVIGLAAIAVTFAPDNAPAAAGRRSARNRADASEN